MQLKLPAEAHAALRGSTACGTASWDCSAGREGSSPWGRSQCHTQSLLTFVHTWALVCAPQTAAEPLTQRMGQNTHKPQNAEVRRAGRRWRSSSQQDLRRWPAELLVCQCWAALCPWKQEEMMPQLVPVPGTKTRFQEGSSSRPTPITIKWRRAPRNSSPTAE